MITNFHLPKSTLTDAGQRVRRSGEHRRAYEEAKRLGYRFFSFGDAMFIR